jgi:hypothetical protein
MNATALSLRPLSGLILRALAIVLLLSAPVLAVPAFDGADATRIIEAPRAAKYGMGFVLLISLQR